MDVVETNTILDLEKLRDAFPELTEAVANYMVEGADVSLMRHGHRPGISFKVRGETERDYELFWSVPWSEPLNRSWGDQNQATEYGALCIALLLVLSLTEYSSITQSPQGNGIDYFLSKSPPDNIEDIYKHDARLEVSGIFDGTPSEINTRFRIKLHQSQRDETWNTPLCVCVVEFHSPQALWRIER